ncbi:MAG: TrkH family potassium uptake protein [Treponema sp.]|uniref:TrkH family potassium uptake protein n=1 Tax=Treponema sp. TaxID=166 RepID=UPI003FA2B05E
MNTIGAKLRANLSGVAFILSLAVLFLQQFYASFAVVIVIHVMDGLILSLIIAETVLPIRQEKYIQQYFRKNIGLYVTTLLFCTVFVILKIKIGLIPQSPELILMFALVKNIFLFGKIIKNTADTAGGTERVMLNPAGTLLVSFFMVIITGAFLLMLPAATPGTDHLDFLTALFTATSAVCVTGLSVINVATDLTAVGKVILILLVQIGGLGIMVFSFFGMLAFRRKLSIAEKLTVSYMVSEDDMSGLFKALRVIIFSTFLVEAISACFLFLGFSRTMGISVRTLQFAAFHAVSAFCNAGFALFPNNLESFTGDPIISLTVSFTIILGGIGFAVMYDVVHKVQVEVKNLFAKNKKTVFLLPLNTQIVLAMTAGALFLSFSAFYLLEHTHTMKDFSLTEQYLGAFFQAVTLRTAGFSTVSFASLTNATLLMMIFVMFAGGASGSTAGGVKLNTVAVVFAFFRSFLKNDRTVVIKKMSVPDEQVKKAFLIFGFGLSIVCAAVFVLTITESLPFLPMAFETVSAFATVGLSTGLTGQFSITGKLILIFLMFIGRVGPLTILTAAGKKERSDTVDYPYGDISIG